MSTKPFVVQNGERNDQVAICNKINFFFFSARGAAASSVPTGIDLAQEMDQGDGVFFKINFYIKFSGESCGTCPQLRPARRPIPLAPPEC